MRNERVDTGGLMRCCTATLSLDWNLRPDHKPEQDEVLECKWCEESMIFREIDHTWRWNKPEDDQS